MKNIQIALTCFAALVLSLLTSCAQSGEMGIPLPGGGAILIGGSGQQIQPRYQRSDCDSGYGGHQNLHGHRQNSERYRAEKFIGRQEFRAKNTRGVGIEIQGSPPEPVCIAVKEAVGEWCKDTHSKTNAWPTREQATVQAQQEFARRGYNIRAVKDESDEGPNTFMIVRYDLHKEVLGERQPFGEREIISRTPADLKDVPQEILDPAKKDGKGKVFWMSESARQSAGSFQLPGDQEP